MRAPGPRTSPVDTLHPALGSRRLLGLPLRRGHPATAAQLHPLPHDQRCAGGQIEAATA